jgi:hypothetical protein
MSLAIKFEDVVCESVSVGSSWKNKIKCSSAECQTPSEMYQFEDAETQSGLFTETVEEVVSKKDRGYSLLNYLCEYRENRTREVWAEMIAAGKATVDGEVVTNVDAAVEPEQYIEVVNETVSVQVRPSLAIFLSRRCHGPMCCCDEPCCRADAYWGEQSRAGVNDSIPSSTPFVSPAPCRSHMSCLLFPLLQTEILKSDFGAQTESSRNGSDEDGVGSCERELSEPEGDAVSGFLRRVLPELEEALEGNTTSSAFDGYLQNLRGEGHHEGASLWKTLTVDLEKHKVGGASWD